MNVELQRIQNIEKNMTIISKQFTFMRSKYEKVEKERKYKRREGTKK